MRSLISQVYGLPFALVAKAMEHINVPSHVAEEYATWLEENNLHTQPHVAVWPWSEERDWALEEGRSLDDLPFFPYEGFGGGWYHFQEADVIRLEARSMSSGSRLVALKSRATDGWSLTLEVPAPCRPYDWGSYSQSFEEATRDRIVFREEGILEMTSSALEALRRNHPNLWLEEDPPLSPTRRRPRRKKGRPNLVE